MNLNNCIASNCLSKLISLRSSCIEGNCTPFYIEDLDGVDMNFLTSTAPGGISASAYVKQVIDTATRLMLGDIELLMSNTYNMISSFGETCSTSSFLGFFQPSGGLIVKNVTGSKYSILKVTKLEINCNALGQQVLVFDDGKEVKKFPFTAMGVNVVTPVNVNYATTSETVKISLEDPNILVAAIDTTKTSGCGCSGGSVAKDIAVNYGGLLSGLTTSQQYGFKVCATITCSSDLIVCQMVGLTPNVFGLTLLYKIGAILYASSTNSIRNNRVTGFGIEQQQTMQDYYESLYLERLNGSKTVKGVKNVIGDYLTRNKDKCITCESSKIISAAIG